ncbi:MAG: nuclear transport factor 2 family protein [Pseudomonadales bacterium]|nr:nuclear transport factor 2 family protein [Pseudomonadales bacterium]MCP5183332.1 nuclear transport factor 2 family protein [Pseudomonadales bacterium]
MGYAIDPHKSWLPLLAAADSEKDPRRAQLIREVAVHMETEITGQLEPLMATLTAEPVYHFWGNGQPMVLEGRETIRGFYANMMAAGGQQFEVVVERVIADTNHVVTEGRVKQVYRGTALRAMGVTEVGGTAVSDDSLWLSDAQLITVWPADAAGKLIGEDIYFGVEPMKTLKPITASDLPPYYVL